MARSSQAPTPIHTVRSVLLHEQRLGYSDRATIGGLAGFWQHWLPRLEAAHPGEAARSVLGEATHLLASYDQADPADRKERVSACLALLDRLGHSGPPPRPLNPRGTPLAGTGTRGSSPSPARAAPQGPRSTPPSPPSQKPPPGEKTDGALGSSPERVPAPPASAGGRPAPAPEARPPLEPVSGEPDGRGRASQEPGEKPPRHGQRPQLADKTTTEPLAARPAPAPSPRAVKGRVVRTAQAPTSASDLDAPVTLLPRVGPANAERLARLGLRTIRDLLYYFPTRHIDYRDVRSIRDLRDLGSDAYQTILGTVADVRVERLRPRAGPGGQWMFRDVPEPRPGRPGLLKITVRITDATGSVEAVWIRAHDYLSRDLTPGRQVIVSGQCRLKWRGDTLEFVDPDHEFVGGVEAIHTARLVPVYRRTEGVGERWLRRLIKLAVDAYAHQLVDHLPATMRQSAGLLDLPTAIAQIHFPDSPEFLERAHRRLAFDELFLIQLGVLDRRREWQAGPPGHAMKGGADALRRFVESLPYALTGAQRRVLDEIVGDMASTRPMSRLLQGEVGSGKTVVAAGACIVALANGFQAAIMAPTEILAEQHHRTLGNLLGAEGLLTDADGHPRPVRLGLLVGSLRRAEKLRLHQQIARGELDVIVGTHALIQEGVEFQRLGLAIVDEQHRFGVLQRTTLRQKGESPHLLVMTATPIPRTLALTLYGDLDLSVIDELPPGRQEIRTRCFGPGDRQAVYEGIREEVRAGRQAYIICPLVEESEKLEAKAATAEYERLRRLLPDLRLGLLHGRMKPAEKDEVMRAFQRGELDVLVATAVVEVGIDVPNATCMVIEGADRFGLAQLHQFRGRIGRGSERSYCALISESSSETARERLELVASTRDGFRLAEEDLRLRGPGEFFGTRQSGLPDVKLAGAGDAPLLEQARDLAAELFRRDEGLRAPEHRLLAERVSQLWQRGEMS